LTGCLCWKRQVGRIWSDGQGEFQNHQIILRITPSLGDVDGMAADATGKLAKVWFNDVLVMK
jgi:hypothetical protein